MTAIKQTKSFLTIAHLVLSLVKIYLFYKGNCEEIISWRTKTSSLASLSCSCKIPRWHRHSFFTLVTCQNIDHKIKEFEFSILRSYLKSWPHLSSHRSFLRAAFAHSPRDFVDLLEGLFGHKQNIFILRGDGFPSFQPPIQPCQSWLPYATLCVCYVIDWTDCIFLKLTESENCIFVQFSLNLFILFFVHRGSIYVFIHSFFLPWQRSQLVFCVPFDAAGIKYFGHFGTVSFLTHYYSNSENVDHPKGYGHLLCPTLDYFYEVLLLFLSFCCCFLTFRHFIEPKNERRINILQNIFLTWKTFLAMVNCDLP